MAPDDLTLDLRPPKPSFPNFLSKFLLTDFIQFNAITTNDNFDVFVVNDYIHRLDDELKKIQAFQRELPLSFLLLHDVIGKLKEVTKEKNEEKELDKNVAAVNSGIEEFEKKTWLSFSNLSSQINEQGVYEPPHKGAKTSFRMTIDDDFPGLSLVPPGLKFNGVDEPGSGRARASGLYSGSVYFTKIDKNGKPGIKMPYQTTRKLRRRWSSELHRRFEDALEKLGGSKVATPKQIRDLMQVDGLTNNEVKSHLQKYRLHVRKLPAASTTTRLSSDLDGIDDLELDCSTQDLQHSSSPKGPFHMGMSKKCSSSSAEEDEEEKSDGRSWKAHNDI